MSPVGCAQISLPARSPAGVSATPEKKQTLSRENLVRQGKERDKESAPCARLDNVVPMTAAPSSARASSATAAADPSAGARGAVHRRGHLPQVRLQRQVRIVVFTRQAPFVAQGQNPVLPLQAGGNIRYRAGVGDGLE